MRAVAWQADSWCLILDEGTLAPVLGSWAYPRQLASFALSDLERE